MSGRSDPMPTGLVSEKPQEHIGSIDIPGQPLAEDTGSCLGRSLGGPGARQDYPKSGRREVLILMVDDSE